MKRFHLLVLITAIFIIPLSLGGGAVGAGQILRVADGSLLSLPKVVEQISKSRLIFVGEIHNYPSHHTAQLEVIRLLNQAIRPLAVGLEMFRRDSQPYLDRWTKGELRKEKFKKIYYRNWNYPWHLYRDIFFYARKHRIPMIGLNVSPEITRQVAREGFASLSKEQLGDLPMVTCRVGPDYMAFIRRSLGMHGHGSMDFTRFCEAQLVWDTAMAWNLMRFLKGNSEAKVVVLAGSGHAWKPGVPAQIQSRSSYPFRVILPEIPGRAERNNVSVDEADYVWLGLR